jgi:tetratricopeptide (TPR) repeat protein
VTSANTPSDPGTADQSAALHEAALTALHGGHLHDARRLADDAIRAARATFGADSPEVANVLLTAATAEEVAGDFRAAQTLAESAARVAAPFVDADRADLMSLWVSIEVVSARLLVTLGEFDAAETRMASALAAATRVLAGDDRVVLGIHNLRGIIGKYTGRFEDAEAHYMRVRAALEAQPDIDEQALAVLLHNLGGLEHARGRFADGLTYALRGLDLRIKAVGAHHPDVARDLNAVAALHQDAGEDAAAAAAARQALEIFEDTLGADHYEVGMTCANLAVSTAAAGDTIEARLLYLRALSILASHLGADHPDVAHVQRNFAKLPADERPVL